MVHLFAFKTKERGYGEYFGCGKLKTENDKVWDRQPILFQVGDINEKCYDCILYLFKHKYGGNCEPVRRRNYGDDPDRLWKEWLEDNGDRAEIDERRREELEHSRLGKAKNIF